MHIHMYIYIYTYLTCTVLGGLQDTLCVYVCMHIHMVIYICISNMKISQPLARHVAVMHLEAAGGRQEKQSKTGFIYM